MGRDNQGVFGSLLAPSGQPCCPTDRQLPPTLRRSLTLGGKGGAPGRRVLLALCHHLQRVAAHAARADDVGHAVEHQLHLRRWAARGERQRLRRSGMCLLRALPPALALLSAHRVRRGGRGQGRHRGSRDLAGQLAGRLLAPPQVVDAARSWLCGAGAGDRWRERARAGSATEARILQSAAPAPCLLPWRSEPS